MNASASGGSSVSGPATPTPGSPSARLASRWAAQATRGPSANPPSNATARRLMPRAGPNTKKVIESAGMFSVAEPCTTATAPPIPPPPRRYAVEMGTMQAEHRFSTGPIARPLAVRAIAPLGGLGAPAELGEQERLSQARHQESKHHARGDQPEIGGGELPPRRQQARIGRGLGAETLEAGGLCP